MSCVIEKIKKYPTTCTVHVPNDKKNNSAFPKLQETTHGSRGLAAGFFGDAGVAGGFVAVLDVEN